MFLAAAYAEQGDGTKARAMRDRAVAAFPGLTIERWKAECAKYLADPGFWQVQERYLLRGLREAGVPER